MNIPARAGSVREGLDETLTVLTLQPLDPPAAVARHDQRRRASAESHPPREAQRETVAWWTDDAAVGGCRCSRSRQGLPASEGMRRYAALRHRASRTRSTTGARCLRGERRVESHPSRRRVSTAVGTSLVNWETHVDLIVTGPPTTNSTVIGTLSALLQFMWVRNWLKGLQEAQ